MYRHSGSLDETQTDVSDETESLSFGIEQVIHNSHVDGTKVAFLDLDLDQIDILLDIQWSHRHHFCCSDRLGIQLRSWGEARMDPYLRSEISW